MKLSARQRLLLCGLAFGLVCLSLAVFNWGLQYKMSLYQNIGGVVHAPAAKLWMGKDGGSSTVAQVPLPERAPVFLQVTLLLTFLTLYLAVRHAGMLRTLLHWRLIASSFEPPLVPLREAFFVRPPPATC
jgi:hypothetical protein